MRIILLACLTVLFFGCDDAPSVSKGYVEEIETFRKNKNKDFTDPAKTPLPEETDWVNFSGLNYYDVDPKYKVKATLDKTTDAAPFEMKATGQKTNFYKQYAVVKFEIDGKPQTLNAYQNLALLEEDEDHLFIPFKDKTSGETSYGGGRYLDVSIPENDTLVLDFNMAYNPYCAYNYIWSCPVPPRENWLNVRIEAGEKKFEE